MVWGFPEGGGAGRGEEGVLALCSLGISSGNSVLCLIVPIVFWRQEATEAMLVKGHASGGGGGCS